MIVALLAGALALLTPFVIPPMATSDTASVRVLYGGAALFGRAETFRQCTRGRQRCLKNKPC